MRIRGLVGKLTIPISGVSLLAIAGCTAASSSSANPVPIMVRGEVHTLLHRGLYGESPGSYCEDSPGWSLVQVGTAVIVSDDRGTLGIGRLRSGTVKESKDGEPRCYLPFKVNVPGSRGLYKVKVGNFPEQSYSEDELRQHALELDDGSYFHRLGTP
ncbi:hypothetical protein [Actinomadura alba]|uniref:Lipoprotein n=1 Tax=Actinomadura alba TaxID=406431 RepID=A0ABR7M2D7_9ACTN|nr:hypothetical protein [Actinomadura alba]MBC6471180.1 hypothetical protein [Actinomadura alba]